MSMLYLIRHGETDDHLQKRALGRLDVELNQRGRQQAELLAVVLRKKGIRAIYSSPLTRCLQTALPLAGELGMEVGLKEGLQEIDLGIWDGLPLSRIYEVGGEGFTRWLSSPAEVRIPGGELLGEVRERVIKETNMILAEHSVEEDVALFSHGGPLRLLLCAALGLDPNHIFRLEVDLASISAIKCFGQSIEKDVAVAVVNDTCHLGASRSSIRG